MVVLCIVSLAFYLRKLREKHHKQTEIHYISFVEHSPNIVLTIDKNGVIKDVNSKGLEILKEKRELIISKSVFSFIHDSSREIVKREFNELPNFKAKSIESLILDGEGNWTPVLIHLVPILIDAQLTDVFFIASDITELVEHRERIKKGQRELIDTLQGHQGVILKYVRVGDRYIHTLCSGELLSKLALPSEKVLGRDLRDFLPKEHAEVKLKYYKKAWNGEVTDYEAYLNGVYYYMNLNPVYKDGKIVEVIGSGVDITDRKRAEQLRAENEDKLKESHALRRTIIDNLPMGLAVTDNDLKIIAANRTFCELIKIREPIKKVIGKSIVSFRKNFYLDEEKEVNRITDIMENKRPAHDEFETKDHRILKRSYFPFLIDNELKGHLWTFEDITDRKLMEKRIIEAKEEAIKANLAKSEFLSKMSHELRTPLNGILGFSQILELDQTLTEQQQRFVREILNGGRHLLDLINEILDLSRIETGKLKIKNNIVDIGSIIEECVNLLEPAANKKGIQIRKNLLNCEDKSIYIDQTRIRQVILNLLDNAVKYNKENGEILITSEYKDATLTIHVIDNGIGIPEEELSRIYEPFYRLGNINEEGAGIGLALVRQLIDLMGGDVGVSSQMGEGSDFWFRIPISPISHWNILDSNQNDKEKNKMPSLRQNTTILYIEDYPSNLALMIEILADMNITLISAESGEKGLRLAAQEKIDLILLDIHLPDMDGYEVLKRLKINSLTEQIPIIALSANAMPDDINHALAKGFKEYITKPIDIQSFLNKISKYV